MSITIIYTCDKCGSEQEKPEQFWQIGVVTKQAGLNVPTLKGGNYETFTTGKSLQICRPCLESFGIFAQKKEGIEQPEPPTTEELIVDILDRCGIHPSQ